VRKLRLKSGAVPSKLSRPECGTVAGIVIPPDVGLGGMPCGKESSPRIAIGRKPLTEEPSCEAEDMTALANLAFAAKQPLICERHPGMTMLYRSTDRLTRRGARMQNLAHSASFESPNKDAPSKAGTKHLGSLVDMQRRGRIVNGRPLRMFSHVDPLPGVVAQGCHPLDLYGWKRDGIGQGLGPARS
jgi:hypothetical protein